MRELPSIIGEIELPREFPFVEILKNEQFLHRKWQRKEKRQQRIIDNLKTTYLFEIVQHIAPVHTRMRRNLEQFRLLVFVHLDLLDVFFPRFDNLKTEVDDLVK